MSYGLHFATVNATADGDNELVEAVSGKQIQVVSYVLNILGSGLSLLRDATAATERARLQGAATTGNIYSFNGSPDSPAFECAPGEALEVNNAAGNDTTGHLTYRLI